MNIDEMLKLFPKDSSGNNIVDLEKEINDFVEKRLIASYITNDSLKKTLPEWQEFYISQIKVRSGITLERRNIIINKLAIAARNFHAKRKNLDVSIEDTCKSCNFKFNNGYRDNLEEYFDILNPVTYPLNRERNVPNIDHIDPISKIGGNDKSNLQTLCWVCNSGKSDICSGLDQFDLFSERVKMENLKSFVKSQLTSNMSDFEEKINFMPKSLFYRVLNRERSCHICKKNDTMLTMMPIYKNLLFTYDNLIPICYKCLEKSDTIGDIRWIKIGK